MFIHFWEIGRDKSASVGGVEREGDIESEAGSRLWAVSTEPDARLEPTNHKIMTYAKVRCLTDWATQVPHQDLNSYRSIKFVSTIPYAANSLWFFSD